MFNTSVQNMSKHIDVVKMKNSKRAGMLSKMQIKSERIDLKKIK